MKINVQKVSDSKAMDACLAIRHVVFVEGQNVPLNEELDGKDKDSEHYLLNVDNHPVGVARVRYLSDFAKIERVAVLDSLQGRGLGKYLMEFILNDLACNTSLKSVKLSSQISAISFYEKLGFIVCSDEYIDAGIPHKDMKLMLRD
ncbi:MAG TPA: GNAT family N-acetyltransferase [Legionella sp.]|nr:GNAT family N-acetyltransferase [Legionella sp.]